MNDILAKILPLVPKKNHDEIKKILNEITTPAKTNAVTPGHAVTIKKSNENPGEIRLVCKTQEVSATVKEILQNIVTANEDIKYFFIFDLFEYVAPLLFYKDITSELKIKKIGYITIVEKCLKKSHCNRFYSYTLTSTPGIQSMSNKERFLFMSKSWKEYKLTEGYRSFVSRTDALLKQNATTAKKPGVKRKRVEPQSSSKQPTIDGCMSQTKDDDSECKKQRVAEEEEIIQTGTVDTVFPFVQCGVNNNPFVEVVNTPREWRNILSPRLSAPLLSVTDQECITEIINQDINEMSYTFTTSEKGNTLINFKDASYVCLVNKQNPNDFYIVGTEDATSEDKGWMAVEMIQSNDAQNVLKKGMNILTLSVFNSICNTWEIEDKNVLKMIVKNSK